MKTNMKGWVVVFLLLVVLAWGELNAASATIINVEGLKYGEKVSAVVDFEYVPINAKKGEIRFLIENTSDLDISVTALYANLPDGVWKARPFVISHWKSLFRSDSSFHASMLGFKRFTHFKPIKQGESAEFTMLLKGKSLDGLSDDSFLDSFMDDGLAFYLKGKDSSGKFRFDTAVPATSGMHTPIPSAVFLLGPALAMIGALRWTGRKMKTR